MAQPPSTLVSSIDLKTGSQLIKQQIREPLDSIRYEWDDFAVVGGCPIPHPLHLKFFHIPDDHRRLAIEEARLSLQNRPTVTDQVEEEQAEEEAETGSTDTTNSELWELTSSDSSETTIYVNPRWLGIFLGSGEMPPKTPKARFVARLTDMVQANVDLAGTLTLGEVSLPLDDAGAEKFKSVASPISPYAWRLEPKQVAFCGQGFEALIEQASLDFQRATGVQERLHVEMVSLVLHGKGASVPPCYAYDHPCPDFV